VSRCAITQAQYWRGPSGDWWRCPTHEGWSRSSAGPCHVGRAILDTWAEALEEAARIADEARDDMERASLAATLPGLRAMAEERALEAARIAGLIRKLGQS
jgi:hypothetical protein